MLIFNNLSNNRSVQEVIEKLAIVSDLSFKALSLSYKFQNSLLVSEQDLNSSIDNLVMFYRTILIHL